MVEMQKVDLGSDLGDGVVVFKISHIDKRGERYFVFITRRTGKFFKVYISNEEHVVKCMKSNPSFEACYIYCLKVVNSSISLELWKDSKD
jgi:hypothetical protein